VYGIQIIHQEHSIHRDLKLENILIHKSNNNNSFLIKISDFGTARMISTTKLATTFAGFIIITIKLLSLL
jgi:serine/threonine protein kinase